MSSKSHYRILSVATNATHEQIKAAYRKIALKLHPDLNHGSKVRTEQFKEASEAYRVLSDVSARKEYDTLHGIIRPGSSSGGGHIRVYGHGGSNVRHNGGHRGANHAHTQTHPRTHWQSADGSQHHQEEFWDGPHGPAQTERYPGGGGGGYPGAGRGGHGMNSYAYHGQAAPHSYQSHKSKLEVKERLHSMRAARRAGGGARAAQPNGSAKSEGCTVS